MFYAAYEKVHPAIYTKTTAINNTFFILLLYKSDDVNTLRLHG